ncbi:MAG: phage tail protein [Pigmentiphaga sp.]
MDYYLGEVVHLAFDYETPELWYCDGRLLRITEHEALHAIIRTQYGGDGVTTFAAPDLRGKSPLDRDEHDCHYFLAMSGIFPSHK